MGAEERQPQPDLNQQLGEFEKKARRFAFFRLIYLLERLHPKAPAVGQLGPAADEKIRLRSDPSLIFHSSDVTEATTAKYPDDRERIRVSTTSGSLRVTMTSGFLTGPVPKACPRPLAKPPARRKALPRSTLH